MKDPAPTAETQISPLYETFVALGGCCCLSANVDRISYTVGGVVM